MIGDSRFQEQLSQRAVRSPAAIAAWSTLIYLVLCGTYIIVSGRMAAHSVASGSELNAIESTENVVFIAVTALMFFGISFARWRRIQRQEHVIMEQAKALIRTEQRNVAALYSATLAHDLNNLLFGIQGLVENLQKREQGDEFLTAMRTGLGDSISGLTALARRISSTAATVVPDTVIDVNFGEVLERLSSFASNHPDLRNTEIRIAGAADAILRLNPVLLEEAILNLLINAGQAAGRGGRIEIRLKEAHDATWLEVHDNGPGVPADQADKIFEPCFTSKPDGTGLGMLAVRALANSCNGEIRVERSDLGGALFAIRFPRKETISTTQFETTKSHDLSPLSN
jgi:signal transduction histidine kinase